MTFAPIKAFIYRSLIVSILVSIFGGELYAQYTSNKGRDFWVGYTDHIDGSGSGMQLYITSENTTNGVVSIPGQNWSQSFTVTANNVTIVTIPSSKAYVGSSEIVENRGIHVESADDIIVYSHIYSNARSEATLVLPVQALGREYYAMTFEQKSSGNHRYSQFMVIALEDDTEVEITPTQATLGSKNADEPFTVYLDSGECYQVQSTDDLTGSKILSVSANAGVCKKIAVFSGSGFTSLGCASANSGDNLYEQLYPVSSWGYEFATSPFKTRIGGDWYRILVSEDGTSINVNNSTGSYNKGDIIDFQNSTANYISSDKPICLAQFSRTQGCDNITGDPSMIIIPPAEQGLNKITLYSSPNQNITGQYINVVIPTLQRNSFKLDNTAITSGWSVIPARTSLSYIQLNVSNGNHYLEADTEFVATAYGFGNVESYGYVAGSNAKNLIQNISLSSDTVCKTKPVRFKGFAAYTPSSWLWEFGDGDTSHQANPSHVYQDTGTYWVTLVTTKNNGNDCNSKDSTSFPLRVGTSPIANFGFDAGCSNQPVLFTDSSETGGNGNLLKWEWIINDSTKLFNKNSSFTFDDGGTFDVSLVVYNTSYCSDTITKTVSLIHAPKAKFNYSDLCFKDTAEFIDSSTISGGNLITATSWDFGDGSTSTDANNTHFYKLPGVYEVTLIEEGSTGCNDTLKANIRKYPDLKADFEANPICFPDTVTFINKSLPDTGGIYTWIYEFGDGTPNDTVTINNLRTVKHYYGHEGEYDATLRIYNENGCISKVTKVVKVNPFPNADFTIDKHCQNEEIEFSDNSTISSGHIQSWSWQYGDGASGSGKKSKHQYPNKGFFNIRMIATTNSGCKDTIFKQVQVHPAPSTNFTVAPVCLGNEADFTNNTTINGGSISNWLWKFGDGNTSADQTPIYKYKDTATYKTTLIATSDEGCADTAQAEFKVHLLPHVDFDAPNECINNGIVFNNKSSIRQGSISNFTWNLDDGIVTSADDPQILYSEPGEKHITLRATTNNGCIDSATKTIRIHPKPELAFIADDVCLGEETDFLNRSGIKSGVVLYYTWDFDDNTTSIYKEPDHTYKDAGIYNITMTGESDMGCKDTMRQMVVVNSLPVASIAVQPSEVCKDEPVSFSAAASFVDMGKIDKWEWNIINALDTNDVSFDWRFRKAGTYSTVLKVTSDRGCSTKDTFRNTVTVYELPFASFYADPDTISSLDPKVNLINRSIDGTFYEWTFGDNSPSSFEINPVYEYGDTGTYDITLNVTDTRGCKHSVTRKVYVYPDYTIFMPNSFSPNGDSLNDVFKPTGVYTGVVDYHMAIYNRWGEIIFESNDINQGWDGKTAEYGEWAPNGAYVYIIRISGYDKSIMNLKGMVYVKR